MSTSTVCCGKFRSDLASQVTAAKSLASFPTPTGASGRFQGRARRTPVPALRVVLISHCLGGRLTSLSSQPFHNGRALVTHLSPIRNSHELTAPVQPRALALLLLSSPLLRATREPRLLPRSLLSPPSLAMGLCLSPPARYGRLPLHSSSVCGTQLSAHVPMSVAVYPWARSWRSGIGPSGTDL